MVIVPVWIDVSGSNGWRSHLRLLIFSLMLPELLPPGLMPVGRAYSSVFVGELHVDGHGQPLALHLPGLVSQLGGPARP
jgi:hypothetical protein